MIAEVLNPIGQCSPAVLNSAPSLSAKINMAKLEAFEARALDKLFVSQYSLKGLASRLPLRWPAPPDLPASPKRKYRSHYVYQSRDDLDDPLTWEHLSDFELLLHLVDFSNLRPVLAQLLGWTSARGQIPFDPVSLFLLVYWQVTNSWTRTNVLAQVQKLDNAKWAQRLGFRGGIFPTEGGLRYFLTTLGQNSNVLGISIAVEADQGIEQVVVQALNRLIIQSVALFHQAGLLSQSAWQQALICPDGMLHPAASRLRCTSVAETCYQPTSPDHPRPCPAKDKDRQGCPCDSPKCAQLCCQAYPRDIEARYVWHEGSNQPHLNPNQPNDPAKQRLRGYGVQGYLSTPLQFADPGLRYSLILLDAVLPANACELYPSAALLRYLNSAYPSLTVSTVAGDANFGRDPILSIVYNDLHARRVIDLRADPSDSDKSLWPIRGYDDKGRPVCPFAYRFTANGFDPQRHRYKWFCEHACLNAHQPVIALPDVPRPPADCTYLKPDHPHGQIIDVALAFKDGSNRLARDFPVGTPTWKQFYHRARNAVEGRNSAFENWHLKRMPVFGLPRVKALIFIVDSLINLMTLARLVHEASTANRAA